ncbi:MAG: Uma2 family endonuclease [Flammeovirgaceae bacterium]|jgi:Uma2 family endonuclease
METLEKTISPEEYLKISEESKDKLEYLNGEIIAMAGTTLEHVLIVKNLILHLEKCLKAKGCTLVFGDVRLYVPECEQAYFYPDIHIYCNDSLNKQTPFGTLGLTEPDYIIEVLSKSTRDYDRGNKFECYRKIKSLKKYVMIESQLADYAPAVFVRNWENDRQFLETKFDLEEKLEVLGCEIQIKDIYDLPNFGELGG